MSNDLLRRLDECSVSRHQSRKVNETCLEAAARIRELEAERDDLRSANSSLASESICHGSRTNDLLTCPNAPCDYCLQWQRQRAERAEAERDDYKAQAKEYWDIGLKRERERDALRALLRRWLDPNEPDMLFDELIAASEAALKEGT